MKTIRLNTIIFPSDKVIKRSIELSRNLSKQGEVYFVLDGKQYFPHITLYSPEYPSKNVDKVLETVSETAKQISKFKLSFKEFTLAQDGGIYANYYQPPPAIKLKKIIIDKLNPLRDSWIRKKYQNLDNFSSDQQTEIQKYGYPISKYHYPHITLSVFKDIFLSKKASKELSSESFPDFEVSKLAVCEMGIKGSCTKILHEHKL